MKQAAQMSVHEAASVLKVSPDTIRRWEKKGLIKASRSFHNHRQFDIAELQRLQKKYSGEDSETRFRVLKAKIGTPHTVLELFSGCGGLALGLENAGLNARLLVEIDKDCIDTLKKNRPYWKILHGDISSVNFSEYAGKIDVVAGGFPCQAFSYAGHKRGFDDTRGTLFFEFARCISTVRPRIALAENVRGLLRHEEGRTLNTMVKVLDELGYDVAYKLMRCQFLDVPQKRERLLIIGVRRDMSVGEIFFPKERDYTVSLKEALRKCGSSAGALYPTRKRQIMEKIPEGGYWRDLPPSLQREYMKGSLHLGGGKTGMARRLAWNEPSLTLTCNPAQKQTERCHPAETRPLNVREYSRIQSFPDSWIFSGSLTSQYRQIGNAVPVNFGFHIGRCLIGMLQKQFDGRTMVAEKPIRPLSMQLSLEIEVAS